MKIVGADSATVRRYSNNQVSPAIRSTTRFSQNAWQRELAACKALANKQAKQSKQQELLHEHKTAAVIVHLTA